jgi:UDP-3-O-[3-hydroxymyristoyl] glucosamine N-acyltransferase
MAAVVCPPPSFAPGVHPSAVVEATASVTESAHLAPHVVVGERSTIGENVYLGPGTVIGPDCHIGDDCRFIANVTLARAVAIGKRGIFDDCRFIANVTLARAVAIGKRGIFHPGVVLGSDGFGNAMTPDGWVKVPQVGGVCMIAHNVRVGAHTAMASMVAIAGSTTIGKRCMFAGMGGAVGHITICDDVVVAAQSYVSKNVTVPGVYLASFPAHHNL